VRGLGVKLDESGHSSYFWSRKLHGRAHWETLGELGELSLEAARAEANRLNTERARGKVAGVNPFERRPTVTLGEIIEQYVARHVRPNASNADRSAKAIDWQVENLLKHLRDRKIETIRRSEFVALREELHQKRGVFVTNRLIQMLRAALNWSIDKAELWQGPNPVAKIGCFPETKRERFLTKPELDALRDALDKSKNLDLQHFVRLALMTGARKADLLSAKWENVDLQRAEWYVPEPKNKTPYRIALVPAAVEILKERRELADGSGWVFPARKNTRTGHLTDMKRGWGKLLAAAGIQNLRQHDMRRTLASWQAASGASLSVIGKSLGHKSVQATQIYARLDLSPVRSSIEIATQLMFAETPKPKLLPAPKRKKAAGG
jgi:integrase